MKSICVLSIRCRREKKPKKELDKVFAFNVVENPVFCYIKIFHFRKIRDANLISCFSDTDKRGLYFVHKAKDQIKCDAEASECMVQGTVSHSCTTHCMLVQLPTVFSLPS